MARSKASVAQFTTHNDLDKKTRDQMLALLNQNLADIFDLFSQTKQAHWNVKGSQFFQLHELYDKLAEELEDFADVIAERATALGGMAMGTVRMAAASSRLPEADPNAVSELDTVNELVKLYAVFGKNVRKAADDADKAEDMGTSDLFVDISRASDKALWFLEAHLQKAA